MAYTTAYALVAVSFFGYICYEEKKSFGGDYKPVLSFGLVASIFWPICLIVVLGDFIEEFLGRIGRRKNRCS